MRARPPRTSRAPRLPRPPPRRPRTRSRRPRRRPRGSASPAPTR